VANEGGAGWHGSAADEARLCQGAGFLVGTVAMVDGMRAVILAANARFLVQCKLALASAACATVRTRHLKLTSLKMLRQLGLTG
jgi:hypothetical protein